MPQFKVGDRVVVLKSPYVNTTFERIPEGRIVTVISEGTEIAVKDVKGGIAYGCTEKRFRKATKLDEVLK